MLLLTVASYGQSDKRIFTVQQTAVDAWSVYVKFEGPGASNISNNKHGVRTRSHQKLSNGLYLQVYSHAHTQTTNGVYGYYFSLSEDAEGKQSLPATNEPKHGIVPRGVDAWHFRNSDNSGPNTGGPKNVNAPGATRLTHFGDLTMKIRVLETNIVSLGKGYIPTFDKFICLVTVRKSG